MPPNTSDHEATETSPFLERHRSSMGKVRNAVGDAFGAGGNPIATAHGLKDNDPMRGGPPGRYDNDPEMEGLTLYEKKCVLINREVDATGMARYQWNIWALCGFGYVLDLLWAQAFALILGPLKQEMGFPDSQSGNISIAFSAGLTAGAFFWGVTVDIVGRWWAFNLTCLIAAVFGLGLGGAQDYSTFLVLTAFVGFGIGGNIPIDTTICLEFIPQNKRFLLALLSIFQPIGVVLTCAIAYGYIPNYSCKPSFNAGPDRALKSCRIVPAGQDCCSRADNMGWRYLTFTLGAVTLAVFLARSVVFRFKESPKFLVSRGHDDKAIAVLEYMARYNKRQCGVSQADFDALAGEESSETSRTELLGGEGGGAKKKATSAMDQVTAELARYKLLFDGFQMSRMTILVWITYACDYWAFTLAATYLPYLIAVKNGALDLSLEYTYRSYIAVYAPGIVGVVGGAMMYRVPRFGRKLVMMVSSALMGISIFLFSAVNSQESNIGLNAMEYFFQSMFNAVLYGWTPEVFPAPIRGTACGIASFWGRLFSILAPLTAQSLVGPNGLEDPDTIREVLYLAGGLALGCTLATSLLPNKAMGKSSM